MKIVVMDGHALDPGDLGWQGFEALGEFEYYDRTPPQLILPRMAGAGAVLVNKTPITAATLAACPDLRYIGVLATGYNVVDTAAAAARGIPVCNVPDYGTEAVAQFTFALLLELCHRVGDHSRGVHGGEWCQKRISAIGTPPSGNWRALSSAWWATGASAGRRRASPGPSA